MSAMFFGGAAESGATAPAEPWTVPGGSATLGGKAAATPASLYTPGGALHVFYLGTDGQVQHTVREAACAARGQDHLGALAVLDLSHRLALVLRLVLGHQLLGLW